VGVVSGGGSVVGTDVGVVSAVSIGLILKSRKIKFLLTFSIYKKSALSSGFFNRGETKQLARGLR